MFFVLMLALLPVVIIVALIDDPQFLKGNEPLTILLYSFLVYIVVKNYRKYETTKAELEKYQEQDLSVQEGWTSAKLKALRKGVDEGHDLARLAETLHHSVASVRGKLVADKVYDQYLERQVEEGAEKFAEWKKLQRKIGKVVPLYGHGLDPVEDALDNEEVQAKAPDWKLIQSLSENWFDPRLEFCETFHTSPVNKLADPRIQHDVIKHIAAFANTSGGFVLIGFGAQGKLLGLYEDDLRTTHHYLHRLEEMIKKCLGSQALAFISLHMIRWGSEDVCLVSCDKADKTVSCTHQKFNEMMGYKKREGLIYIREKAMTVLKNSEEVLGNLNH